MLDKGPGLGHGQPGIKQTFDVKGDGFPGVFQRFIEIIASAEASRKVGNFDGEGFSFFRFNRDRVVHGSWIPADLMMARAVPIGRSFFGCGTVTIPGFVACLN